MDIKPIHSEKEYEAAVLRIERLMELDENDTSGDDEMEVLAILASEWRREHHPVKPTTPADAIVHAIDDRGIPRREIARTLGGESRVSEIIAGRRHLSAAMIVALHSKFQIPLRSLIDWTAEPKPRGRRTLANRASRRSGKARKARRRDA